MRLSRAANYAMYASTYLAIHGADHRIPTGEIHKACGVPEQHLAKVMQKLAQAGLMVSTRGPKGGFSLVRSPEQITLLQIVEAVDGTTTVPYRHNDSIIVQAVDSCVARGRNLMAGALGSTTLADLAAAIPRR